MTAETPADRAPEGDCVTPYDRRWASLYARLLDAVADGADWRDVTRDLFNLSAEDDAVRARAAYDTHLARAQWMRDGGYRGLLE